MKGRLRIDDGLIMGVVDEVYPKYNRNPLSPRPESLAFLLYYHLITVTILLIHSLLNT